MRLALWIPTCVMCHEWMRPVLLVEHPVQAVIWVCTNGCSTLMQGFGATTRSPRSSAARLLGHGPQDHGEGGNGGVTLVGIALFAVTFTLLVDEHRPLRLDAGVLQRPVHHRVRRGGNARLQLRKTIDARPDSLG